MAFVVCVYLNYVSEEAHLFCRDSGIYDIEIGWVCSPEAIEKWTQISYGETCLKASTWKTKKEGGE